VRAANHLLLDLLADWQPLLLGEYFLLADWPAWRLLVPYPTHILSFLRADIPSPALDRSQSNHMHLSPNHTDFFTMWCDRYKYLFSRRAEEPPLLFRGLYIFLFCLIFERLIDLLRVCSSLNVFLFLLS
jgi:hypothetical protein